MDCALAAMMAVRSRALRAGSGKPDLEADGDLAAELGKELGSAPYPAALAEHMFLN